MRKLLRLPKKGQKAKIKQSDFSEMNKEGFVLPPAPTNLSSTTFPLSCKTLSLESFIKAYCNGDLSGLDVPNETLQSAWNEILFEWSGLIKTENSKYLFDLSKQIGLLQWHIIYVNYALIVLRLKYDSDIVGQLEEMGYIVPDFNSPSYESSINRINSLAKTKVFELNNLTTDYNRLNKTATGKAQSEEDFIGLVLMLAKYQGYNIDRRQTSTFDFAQIFNNYLAEMKIKESQLETYKK